MKHADGTVQCTEEAVTAAVHRLPDEWLRKCTWSRDVPIQEFATRELERRAILEAVVKPLGET